MAKTKTAPVTWNDELAGCVAQITYDFYDRHGEAFFYEGDCCGNPAGCIAAFQRIDPEVETIRTFSGDDLAACYYLQSDGKWLSEPRRPDDVIVDTSGRGLTHLGEGHYKITENMTPEDWERRKLAGLPVPVRQQA